MKQPAVKSVLGLLWDTTIMVPLDENYGIKYKIFFQISVMEDPLSNPGI